MGRWLPPPHPHLRHAEEEAWGPSLPHTLGPGPLLLQEAGWIMAAAT